MTDSFVTGSESHPKIYREQYATASSAGLVFIHALGSDLHLWDRLIECLPKDIRYIRYDLRGHGRSEVGRGEVSLDDHVDDLIRLLDECQMKNATLVGVSVGGMIAMAEALAYPRQVQRLVLCATAGRIGTVENWSERISVIKSKGLAAMADGILARWFSSGFNERQPAIYEQARKVFVNTSFLGYIGTCAVLRDTDLRSRLAQIGQSSLVLAGENDLVTTPAIVHELALGIPNARMETIAGAAHLPPLEQPVSMAEAMLRFWKDDS